LKLSIITINYNNAIGLKKTITSVCNQTWKDFEYIIIDGNSTDNSLEVIKSFDDQKLNYVSEPDTGIYNAMNKGIVMAKGDYLLFLNSGDYIYNIDVLLKVSHYFTSNKSFMSGHLNYIKESKDVIREHPEKLSFSYLINNSLSHPSTFIKKEMFESYGLYNEENKIVSDWEFFLKVIALNGESFVKIPFIITVFDNNGMSSNSENLSLVKSEQQKVLQHYLGTVFNSELDTFIFNQFLNPTKRIRFLMIIEKNPFLRKLTTVFLSFVSKFIK
jgi:glycosyltransferase involved in cell wall biosynthesis